MFIKQLYTNCLAQAAYYVESNGEALIIDPLREPEPYIELANERKAKIKYVFETHFHADFVSGHQEISRRTGAVIVYGPKAKPEYQALIAMDKEIFNLGKIKLQVLHTPGHTIESSCFLIYDEANLPACIFTGDTLFVGDVGRPDLLSGNLSKEELAGMLYDSLNNKIKTLPNQVIVYPGHGAGSACGKNIGKETQSTIGEQKAKNYALQNISKDEFIRAVTNGLVSPPPYFFKDAAMNISGYDSNEIMFKREKKPLDVSEFETEIAKGCLILDTRNAADFEKGFIPGSINIGLNGDFAVWVGTLIEFNQPLLLVCEPGKEKESIIRLARVGYDHIKGYLKNGIDTWKNAGQKINKITSVEYKKLKTKMSGKKFLMLDVRRPNENAGANISGSINIPLNTLEHKIPLLNKTQPYLVYCAGGYRSMIAASILKKHGIKTILNLKGGINSCNLEIEKSKADLEKCG